MRPRGQQLKDGRLQLLIHRPQALAAAARRAGADLVQGLAPHAARLDGSAADLAGLGRGFVHAWIEGGFARRQAELRGAGLSRPRIRLIRRTPCKPRLSSG